MYDVKFYNTKQVLLCKLYMYTIDMIINLQILGILDEVRKEDYDYYFHKSSFNTFFIYNNTISIVTLFSD